MGGVHVDRDASIPAVRERFPITAGCLAGNGYQREGRNDPQRHVWCEPSGMQGPFLRVSLLERIACDFLRRVHQEVPAKGEIGIFNRSHYEDVLITRVHAGVRQGRRAPV